MLEMGGGRSASCSTVQWAADGQVCRPDTRCARGGQHALRDPPPHSLPQLTWCMASPAAKSRHGRQTADRCTKGPRKRKQQRRVNA